jgi:hypothetical protein
LRTNCSHRVKHTVLGNALLSTVVYELTRRVAGDREEGLEDITGQSAAGIFRAVVGHEANDKVVRGRRNDTREGPREVVRVILDAPSSDIV